MEWEKWIMKTPADHYHEIAERLQWVFGDMDASLTWGDLSRKQRELITEACNMSENACAIMHKVSKIQKQRESK